MQLKNTLVRQEKRTFSSIVSGPAQQDIIKKALNDPRRAANFTSTLISVVNANEKLAQCDPKSIISAALRGEGMDLSLALGQFSIVPYGDKANYQISYKGLSQLAMRSGLYSDFDAFDVREGEYKGKNPRTRQPIIEWIEDEDEREKLPLAGIYAFYELKDGFFKSMYWPHSKILDHANRYSQAFSREKYEKMLNGELDPNEVAKLQRGTPWYGEPLSEQHLTMCKKTLILRMLGDGKAPLSIEMRMAIDHEVEQEKGGQIIYEDDPEVVEANAKVKAQKDENIIEGTATVTPAEEMPAGDARTPSSEEKQPTPKSVKAQGDNALKTAPKKRTAQTRQPEAPSGTPLEGFMNPPVDENGLPFA